MPIPRYQVIPQADHQASFHIAGQERTRWHFGPQYPRPFFYPLLGASGASLTRMGHPGDSGHDHHRSVWFAHHKVDGFDFWSEAGKTRVAQQRWFCYQDGNEEAIMAVQLVWSDPDGNPLLRQELIAAVRDRQPQVTLRPGEWLLELQATFTPADPKRAVTLAQTNFGFLAVRVAKSVSVAFGDGRLTCSQGRRSEAEIFGQTADWMDYSGPTTNEHVEGITYFDHPANPGYPSAWHVREDGWMGASVCRATDRTVTADEPLRLRYLLHVHQGWLEAARAASIAAAFGHTPAYVVGKSKQKHTGFEVNREG